MQKLKTKNSKLKVSRGIFAFGKNPSKLLTTNYLSRLSFIKSRILDSSKTESGLRTKNGFTLVETLVAITVLLLAIGGPLTIAAQALFSSNIAKDRLTAAYLAQEGIELTRYLRDNNAISGNTWLDGLDNCISPNTCILGPGLTPAPRLCSGECSRLRIREDSRFVYSPTSNPESVFTRTISITETVPGQEAVVESRVEWQAGGRTHEVELRENLFSWR